MLTTTRAFILAVTGAPGSEEPRAGVVVYKPIIFTDNAEKKIPPVGKINSNTYNNAGPEMEMVIAVRVFFFEVEVSRICMIEIRGFAVVLCTALFLNTLLARFMHAFEI